MNLSRRIFEFHRRRGWSISPASIEPAMPDWLRTPALRTLFGMFSPAPERAASRCLGKVGVKSCIGLIFCAMLLAALTADAGAADQSPDRAFLLDLQKALRTNDRAWLGEHMHYPASYYGPKYIMIKNRAWFDSHYSMLIGSKLRAIVLAQDPDRLSRDRHGITIGSDLNIKYYNFGTGPEDIRYEIITIDDAE